MGLKAKADWHVLFLTFVRFVSFVVKGFSVVQLTVEVAG